MPFLVKRFIAFYSNHEVHMLSSIAIYITHLSANIIRKMKCLENFQKIMGNKKLFFESSKKLETNCHFRCTCFSFSPYYSFSVTPFILWSIFSWWLHNYLPKVISIQISQQPHVSICATWDISKLFVRLEILVRQIDVFFNDGKFHKLKNEANRKLGQTTDMIEYM